MRQSVRDVVFLIKKTIGPELFLLAQKADYFLNFN